MSTPLPQSIGEILWVDLPSRNPGGHEQEGRRPCVVVGNPGSLQTLRYPMLLVAPLTTTGLDSGLVYPVLSGGAGGLRNSSTVLLDQVSSVDVRRVKGFVGQLSRAEYQPIRDGLEALLLV